MDGEWSACWFGVSELPLLSWQEKPKNRRRREASNQLMSYAAAAPLNRTLGCASNWLAPQRSREGLDHSHRSRVNNSSLFFFFYGRLGTSRLPTACLHVFGLGVDTNQIKDNACPVGSGPGLPRPPPPRRVAARLTKSSRGGRQHLSPNETAMFPLARSCCDLLVTATTSMWSRRHGATSPA